MRQPLSLTAKDGLELIGEFRSKETRNIYGANKPHLNPSQPRKQEGFRVIMKQL